MTAVIRGKTTTVLLFNFFNLFSDDGNCSLDQLAKCLACQLNSLRTTKEELLDSLRVFDKNGNNTIFVEDLRRSLTTLGEALPVEIIDELVREVDPDGEGQVNIDGKIHLNL